MNTALTTGYLTREAALATVPGTGQRKLIFEAMLQAEGDPEPTPWHCEVENPELMARAEPKLHAGRAIIMRAQLAGRPWLKQGVHAGYTRYLKVSEIEFAKTERHTEAEEKA